MCQCEYTACVLFLSQIVILLLTLEFEMRKRDSHFTIFISTFNRQYVDFFRHIFCYSLDYMNARMLVDIPLYTSVLNRLP